jgi:hypothetical protein
LKKGKPTLRCEEEEEEKEEELVKAEAPPLTG